LPMTKKRVMFPVLSSIFLATLSKSYRLSAASDAIAAALGLSLTSRAAKALEATLFNSAFG